MLATRHMTYDSMQHKNSHGWRAFMALRLKKDEKPKVVASG